MVPKTWWWQRPSENKLCRHNSCVFFAGGFNKKGLPLEKKLEHILIKSYKTDIVAYFKSHPRDLEEAVKRAASLNQPYSWRAAWAVWSCMEPNDPRIRKYVKRMVNILAGCPDNQLRELLIILQKMKLNEEDEGIVFNVCIDVWEKTGKQPSVRFNAFKMMMKIANKHPGLLNEVKALTQFHYLDSLSAGVRKSVSRLMGKKHPVSKEV